MSPAPLGAIRGPVMTDDEKLTSAPRAGLSEGIGSGELTTPAHLPVPLPAAAPPRDQRRPPRWLLALLLLLGVASAGAYWWQHLPTGLPPGIAASNGRLEADELDIDTKFPGRIARLLADEGDMVKAGQTLAMMDTRDLEASLKKAEAVVRQSEHALDEAKAAVEQQKSQVLLARQELDRARALAGKGWMPRETFDQRQQQLDGATGALAAATAHVAQQAQALDAAKHDVDLLRVNIADNTLVAPRDGRIQYRLANVGEVLGAGGRVFTMLDTAYVYMDIYLPTLDAGRLRIGSEARIVVDAYSSYAIPAHVAFLSAQAQFTPKTVETRDERDKLMFRVRVRIDPQRLKEHADAVRSGLPGMAYVRTDPAAPWPPQLAGGARP